MTVHRPLSIRVVLAHVGTRAARVIAGDIVFVDRRLEKNGIRQVVVEEANACRGWRGPKLEVALLSVALVSRQEDVIHDAVEPRSVRFIRACDRSKVLLILCLAHSHDGRVGHEVVGWLDLNSQNVRLPNLRVLLTQGIGFKAKSRGHGEVQE